MRIRNYCIFSDFHSSRMAIYTSKYLENVTLQGIKAHNMFCSYKCLLPIYTTFIVRSNFISSRIYLYVWVKLVYVCVFRRSLPINSYIKGFEHFCMGAGISTVRHFEKMQFQLPVMKQVSIDRISNYKQEVFSDKMS